MKFPVGTVVVITADHKYSFGKQVIGKSATVIRSDGYTVGLVIHDDSIQKHPPMGWTYYFDEIKLDVLMTTEVGVELMKEVKL